MVRDDGETSAVRLVLRTISCTCTSARDLGRLTCPVWPCVSRAKRPSLIVRNNKGLESRALLPFQTLPEAPIKTCLTSVAVYIPEFTCWLLFYLFLMMLNTDPSNFKCRCGFGVHLKYCIIKRRRSLITGMLNSKNYLTMNVSYSLNLELLFKLV